MPWETTFYSVATPEPNVTPAIPTLAGTPVPARVGKRMSAARPVRKAVFPVAGMGTRFLPATKAMPKEMLPVVDKPVIQYAVEEAREAGIEQFIFVTGRGKHVIDDHFDHAYELESLLAAREKTTELNSLLEMLPKTGSVGMIRQQQPLGLGHAVWCARHFVGNEPFAVRSAGRCVRASTRISISILLQGQMSSSPTWKASGRAVLQPTLLRGDRCGPLAVTRGRRASPRLAR